MAIVNANVPINMMGGIDFPDEKTYGVSSQAFTNVTDDWGTTYPTGYMINLNVNGTYIQDWYDGNFTTDVNGVVTGGVVNGIYRYVWDGNKWNLVNSVRGFSYDAVTIYNGVIAGSQLEGNEAIVAILSGNDTIEGSSGNDILYGGIGNDVIFGNGGTDTAFYMGTRSAYTISQNANGSLSVVDNGSGDGDGSDALYGISFLHFADQTVAVSGLVAPPPAPTIVDFHSLSDILLQNVNGQAAIWDMNGSTLIGGRTLSLNPGPSWKTIGTGDFNDDGHSDILLQNTNGSVAIWEMNGTNVAHSAVVANPGPGWKAIGTGDFNDDGHSDILLQNTKGNVAIWEMNGNNIIAGGTVNANPGPSWHAMRTGDFNSDGHSDILLQSASGQIAIWEMNGSNIMGGGTVNASPGPSWLAIKA
jgi:hypothetical protein